MVTDLSHEKSYLKSFRFHKGNLISIFQAINLDKLKFSGYFQIEFDDIEEIDISNLWYLYFAKGKLVFSSNDVISLTNILEALQNYIPSLRNNNLQAKEKIDEIFFSNKNKDDVSVLRMFSELTLKTEFIEYQQVTGAIQNHLFYDFDRYLYNYSGTVKIVVDKKIDFLRPIVGFNLEQILLMVKQRNSQWEKLQDIIPEMSSPVKCNEQNPKWQKLSDIQKEKIRQLVSSGNTIEEIRYDLGEDSLRIAQTFAKLIEKQLVVIESDIDELDISLINQIPIVEPEIKKSETISAPEIAIIDDSPLLLKRFTSIVTDWGYQVRCCNNALIAVDFLLESLPAIIFLDVNMPHLSGFQLMKQIRLQPELSTIPLVVLTAEKTLMNRQRAKWSKSIFLTKPLNTEEVSEFKSDLKSLLQEMLPYE